jgi:hypothetical protein
MRKTKLAVAVALIGSALFGSAAMANENQFQRRPVVELRDHTSPDGEAPRFAPPALPEQFQAPRLRGYVFIRGEYEFVHGRYVYIPGHYEKVRKGMFYVSSNWVKRGHQFEKVPGHWQRG